MIPYCQLILAGSWNEYFFHIDFGLLHSVLGLIDYSLAFDDILGTTNNFHNHFAIVHSHFATSIAFQGLILDNNMWLWVWLELELFLRNNRERFIARLDNHTFCDGATFVRHHQSLQFLKVHVPWFKGEHQLFAGKIQIYQSYIGNHIHLKNVVLIDDVTDRDFHLPQVIRSQLYGKLCLTERFHFF